MVSTKDKKSGMMYARGKMGFQQKGQVMSLPPDPPLSTSSSHLFLNFYCPKNRGNYNKRLQGSSEIGKVKSMEWTSSKASLTELIYALHHSKAINNGESDIKTIAESFQRLFDIDLSDIYRTYHEIRRRKKERLRFLDELSIGLRHKLDSDNR